MNRQERDRTFDVSVVIPAYRAADFITRAIDSALTQEGVDVEVVVVDDACPMGTGDAVLDRHGDRDDLRVLRMSSNRGPAAARNAGCRAASGEWVAVLDADDAFESGRLARLVRLGREFPADVVADNVRHLDAETGRISPPKIRSISEPTRLDVYDFVAAARPWTGEMDFGLLKPVFTRDLFVSGGAHYPEDVRHGEDFMFYLDLLQRGATFVVTPEPGYVWTLRSSGLSQTSVDYDAQIEGARQLQRLDSVRGDARLVDLLEDRAVALAKYRGSQLYSDAVRSGRYDRALLACLRYPHLMRRVARSAAGRVRQS